MSVKVEIHRIGRGPTLIVESADRLVALFLANDASAKPGGYDSRAGIGVPDRIADDEITAINQTMRARSAHAAWDDLVAAGRLPWLAAIDPEWDLILLESAAWRAARPHVAQALATTVAKGRGLSVATKVLHLKRPRIFPVLDSLVLQTLGVTDAVPPIDIVEHIRAEGRRNMDALRSIQSAVAPNRTLVRILDILLWTTHPAAGLAPILVGWQHVVRPRPDDDAGPPAAAAPVPRRPSPSGGAAPAARREPDDEALRRFDEAMLEVYAAAMREVRYAARRFLAMVRRHGGLETAKRLLKKPGASKGFIRLAEAGKLELTMEYQVLTPTFSRLFSDDERNAARQRLLDHGIRASQLPS